MSNSLATEIFDVSKRLPRSEDYALTSQIRRSSNSVSANIAEGYGRNTKKDKRHFYMMARGSAFETQSHLLYGMTTKYFEEELTMGLVNQYDDLIHQLNKIMKSLN